MAVMTMNRSSETALLKKTTTNMTTTKTNDEQRSSVFFNLVNGKTLCLMVNLDEDEISTIKERLAASVAASNSNDSDSPSFVIASKDMFLVWNGKPLDNDSVLADYNMSPKSHATVFCHQRQRGGCFAVSFSVLMVIIASILGSTVTCGASLIMVPLLLPLLLVLPLCCL